ncbi:MAG: DUF4166 domain-containing protein [Hyphomicrobiales bacterium]
MMCAAPSPIEIPRQSYGYRLDRAPLTVLILGGYGVFGGRLAHLLSDEARLRLIVAGRSLEAARGFCATVHGQALLAPHRFDRRGDVEAQLLEAKPDLVVDASGPFQSYGEDPYRVVRAAISLGIDYLDLADGSQFVKGVGDFDEVARARGVFVLSGVSTCPVLTAAAVRRLSQGMTRLDRIIGGIAPSPRAGVGLNVIRAVAGYAGQRVSLTRDGATATAYAVTETRRYTIAPPGRLPLERRLFSLVDVPDLQVLPELWPELRSIWMGMGPAPAFLHRSLISLAWLVRLRLLTGLAPLAPLMHRAINLLRGGEHRGGMFVAVEGLGPGGERLERSWHLLAEGDDGPFIPSMAAEAIIRSCLEGRRPVTGARAAVRELELADYEALFARRTIFTGFRDDSVAESDQPLYRRLLGESFALLPAPLRAMHAIGSRLTAEGLASVQRGSGLFARMIGAVFGFPHAGRDIPLSVRFESRGGTELWRRNLAGRIFSSLRSAGRGRADRLLRERFGPFAFDLALVIDKGRLDLVTRGWSFLGIPLPRVLAPRGEAYEFAEDGKFHFHVEIGLPVAGLIVRYRGWLVPQA